MKRIALLFLLTLTCLRAQEAPLNIVYIISDDHAWSDYSFMGHAQVKTPHLDQLAKESLLSQPRHDSHRQVSPSAQNHLERSTPAERQSTGRLAQLTFLRPGP
jgi:uncharacterized sulfatase